MNENKIENNQEFEPRIVAFVCNWCTYAGADLTGTSRLKYATNVEIVRFPCTGRIDFMLLLKAFAGGADGIIVSVVIRMTVIIHPKLPRTSSLDCIPRTARLLGN